MEDGVVALPDGILILEAGEVTSAVPGEKATFAAENAVADFVTVYAALENGEVTGLTQLDVRDRLRIQAVYENRITLILGEVASIAGKTDFVQATLARCEQNTPGFKGTIDFSIDKKAYQNAEEDTTTAPPASETPSQADTTENPLSETASAAA